MGQPSTLMTLREMSNKLDYEECMLVDFFECSPDFLLVVDTDCYIMMANKAARNFFGIISDSSNDSLYDLFTQDDHKLIKDVVGCLTMRDMHRFYCHSMKSNQRLATIEFSATKWRGGRSYLVGRMVPEIHIHNNNPFTGRGSNAARITKEQ